MTQSREIERQLRQMILNLGIGPGERITERWAENEFQTSRTPVRAALLHLEGEGLVCREGKGWIIPPINITEIDQLYVYRKIIEIGSLNFAANLITQESLREITQFLAEDISNFSQEDIYSYGTKFHILLSQQSNNPIITKNLTYTLNRLSRIRWLDTDIEHYGFSEHKNIISLIQHGNIADAISVLDVHIENCRTRTVSLLTKNRMQFKTRGITIA